MKTLLEEIGDGILNCLTAGILVATFLGMLMQGAVGEAVGKFMDNIC